MNGAHNRITGSHYFLVLAVSCAGLLLALVSCRSQVDPYELDLEQKGYFQGAIEAYDQGNYKLAIRYYQAFQAKFPDDLFGNLWASYEIAFCTYKMRKFDVAGQLFVELLDHYEELDKQAEEQAEENIDREPFPQGPRILAEKVLAKIRERTNPS
jgi:outer membrane protein assembly factor BamD (BamD/ComL family)